MSAQLQELSDGKFKQSPVMTQTDFTIYFPQIMEMRSN